MSEQEVLAKASALKGRKEYLFEELTNLNDATKSGLSEIDAEVYLRSCNRIENSFERLTEEIINLNVKLDKSSRISTKDFSAIQTLIYAVVKNCLKAKAKAVSEAKSEAREIPNLPTLSLPVWDGDIASWTNFKSQFDSIVHNTQRLSETVKLQYLRSTLKGEPLSIVSQYPLTDESYELAYRDLTSRYENKRRIASYYVDKILTYKGSPASSGREHVHFIEIHRAASSALNKLDIQDLAGFLLFELSYRNLSPKVQKQFDFESDSNSVPNIKNLLDFVERFARSEELRLDKDSFKSATTRKSLVVAKKVNSCYACKQNHMIYFCPEILSLPVNERKIRVKELGCCVACLYKHSGECKSKYTCKICESKNHNSILHEEAQPPSVSSISTISEESKENSSAAETFTNCLTQGIQSHVLLGTIKCHIQDSWGTPVPVRALLDPGSEISIATSSLVNRLGLPILPTRCQVEGIGQFACKPRGSVQLKIHSVHSATTYEFEAAILPKICGQLPRKTMSTELKQRFASMELADPDFDVSGHIQLLLGAEAFADLLSTDEPTVIPGNPTAVRTKFGYVITGRTEDVTNHSAEAVTSLCVSVSPLDESLRRFWEVEEALQETPTDPTDILCEKQTHERDSTGRFIVKLPFIPDALPLGNNEETVLKRLKALEKQFKRNHSLSKAYHNCIQEYTNLGHISIFQGNTSYLLPHHAVFKESSTTTKCRVVFDCSAVDDKGLSLNDRLYRSPPLLKDILLLLLNFRLKPAGYIAGRCLVQLSNLYERQFPAAAKAIRNHRYADDFCTGSETLEESKKLREELIGLLAKGGFEVRRWSSNIPEALIGIPEALKETPTKLPVGDVGVKVLGVMWDQVQDAFVVHVTKFQADIISKRSVLSYIARIYDVMGFFGHTIFLAKHFMQRLWLLKLDWDQPLPQSYADEWNNCARELTGLSDIKVSRLLSISGSTLRLVRSSDASEKGMAASVYLQWNCDGSLSQSHLIVAKTKLSPLKTLTIPRLELLAALLLARVVKHIIDSSEQKFESIHLYTDSTIVLDWLEHPLHELKTFVCNRVAEIRQRVPSASWGHVLSNKNPANLGSRGVPSVTLKDSDLWWHGPNFLNQPCHEWPTTPPNACASDQLPEIKSASCLTIQEVEPADNILQRFSSLTRMQRVLAYVLRYFGRIKSNKRKLSGPLSIEELENALYQAARISQVAEFGPDIQKIKEGKPLNDTLKGLSPFYDKGTQLIRVGGRLGRASFLPEDAKHPIILSGRCHLASLTCDHFHKKIVTFWAFQETFTNPDDNTVRVVRVRVRGRDLILPSSKLILIPTDQ